MSRTASPVPPGKLLRRSRRCAAPRCLGTAGCSPPPPVSPALHAAPQSRRSRQGGSCASRSPPGGAAPGLPRARPPRPAGLRPRRGPTPGLSGCLTLRTPPGPPPAAPRPELRFGDGVRAPRSPPPSRFPSAELRGSVPVPGAPARPRGSGGRGKRCGTVEREKSSVVTDRGYRERTALGAARQCDTGGQCRGRRGGAGPYYMKHSGLHGGVPEPHARSLFCVGARHCSNHRSRTANRHPQLSVPSAAPSGTTRAAPLGPASLRC